MQQATIRNQRLSARFALVMLSIALLSACAAAGNQKSRSLEDTLLAYEKAVRWSNFSTAIQFLHPEHRPSEREIGLLMTRFDQIKVNGYQLRSQSPSNDENTFLQTVQVSFENRHNSRVRSIDDPQVWRWEPEAKSWMLISGLPDITRR